MKLTALAVWAERGKNIAPEESTNPSTQIEDRGGSTQREIREV